MVGEGGIFFLVFSFPPHPTFSFEWLLDRYVCVCVCVLFIFIVPKYIENMSSVRSYWCDRLICRSAFLSLRCGRGAGWTGNLSHQSERISAPLRLYLSIAIYFVIFHSLIWFLFSHGANMFSLVLFLFGKVRKNVVGQLENTFYFLMLY